MAKTKTTYVEKKGKADVVEYEGVYINGKPSLVLKGESVEVPAIVADIVAESRDYERKVNEKPNLDIINE